LPRNARRRHLVGLGLALAALLSNGAAADDGLRDLELTVPFALAERSTTSTDNALAGYGYDSSTGLSVGFEGRLYARFGMTGRTHNILHLGLIAGVSHHAGPLLGVVDSYAMRSTFVDFGIAARVLLLALSDEHAQWRVGGVLALTSMVADVGTGVGARRTEPLSPEQREAATSDFVGLGWRVALDLSVTLDHYAVLGVGVGVRQYFGIDSPLGRSWVPEVILRVGGTIDVSDGDDPSEGPPR